MKQRSSCKNKCACASKKTKTKSDQNGKGDAPRNLSKKFRDNYDAIKWDKNS